MTKRTRELLNFTKDDEQDQKLHFRRLRRARPSKKLWLLVMMVVALAYLVFVMRSKF